LILACPLPSGIYTLSLHDALPISAARAYLPPNGRSVLLLIVLSPAKRLNFDPGPPGIPATTPVLSKDTAELARTARRLTRADLRSEEHTSELQSRENLVCRLLLEK